MIKFEKLTPFYFYRTTKNVHMSAIGKPKKGMLVSVLAPDIESEIKYLDRVTSVFNLRYFERYLIEKWTHLKLYNNPPLKVNNSEEDTKNQKNPNLNGIKTLFSNGINNNTTQVTDFVIYDQSLNTLPGLKDFNFIYEINHAMYYFNNNKKDNRLPSVKRSFYFEFLKSYMVDVLQHEIFSKHTDKILFIPLDLWFNFDSFKSTTNFKTTSDNPIAMLYNVLKADPSTLNHFKGWKFILNNYNEFMVLDIDAYISDKAGNEPEYEQFHDYFTKFMYLCKSNVGSISNDLSEDGVNENMSSAEVDSIAQHETEKLIAKSNIDPDKITKEEMKTLETLVKAKLVDGGLSSDNEVIKSADIDELTTVIKSKMSGSSVENMKRNQMLSEKYKDLKLIKADGRSIDVAEVSTEIHPIVPQKIKGHFANKALENITSNDLYDQYMTQLYYKHLLDILHHFSTCNPKMFMLDNIKEEDVSDHMNKLYRYTVTFEGEDRSRHNMKFLLPKFYQEKYLFLNSSKKDITMQKFPYPITKTAENMTQLSGNYKKIFIERYGMNISPKTTRLIKFLNNYKSTKYKVIKGDTTGDNRNYLTPLEYAELSKSFYIIIIGDYKFIFKVDDAVMEIGPYKGDERIEKFVPFAKTKSNSFYINNRDDSVVDRDGNICGNLSDFIASAFVSTDSKAQEKIDDISVGNRYMYSRAIIMSYNIPVILLASCLHDNHLLGVLDLAKINYTISEKRTSIDKNTQGIVKFEDCYLIYDRYPFSNSLLMEGFSDIPTEHFSLASMGDRETYSEIFDSMYGKRNLIEAFENFKQLFVDPITKQVQERIGGPTNFISMLLMGSDLLSDNNYKIESSYEMSRIRGPEIVLVYLYQALAEVYGKFRIDSKNNKFTIPEDAVIKLLMKSQLIDEHSSVNMILEAENDRRIKSKGPIGLNVDQAYTLEKRAFHSTMKGIVSLSTAASGEVGITRQLTINTNVKDALGFVELNKADKDLDGSELLGPAEMLNVFSVESSDSVRTMMTTGQNKHLIPTKDMTGPLLSTDYEKVIPQTTKDYAFTAKQDGKVLSLENGIMFIEYKDGTKKDINLNEVPFKHTNAGKYHMNNKIARFKVGDKFEKGDIIAYDPKQFNHDIFGDVCANIGTNAKVAIISTGGSYEDSTYIVKSLGKRMATTATVKKDIVVSKNSNIKKFAKIGDNVEVNDYLLIFDDVDDEFAASIIASASEGMEETHFGSKPVKSKVKGTIKDIKVYYTVPYDSLTKSMQSFIKTIASYETEKSKTIKKHMDIKNAETVISPIEQSIPDSLGRIKGVKVEEGVLIEYYVEYLDIEGIGDKVTFSAVKGVINNVIDDEYAAFTESEPDEPIEIFISMIGITKRMVLDIYKIIIGSKILMEAKKDFIKKFGDEINNK